MNIKLDGIVMTNEEMQKRMLESVLDNVMLQCKVLALYNIMLAKGIMTSEEYDHVLNQVFDFIWGKAGFKDLNIENLEQYLREKLTEDKMSS